MQRCSQQLQTHTGPYNSWDRLPFLTTVRNGTASIVLAYNHIVSNFFFSGSANAIDVSTDDRVSLACAAVLPLWLAPALLSLTLSVVPRPTTVVTW